MKILFLTSSYPVEGVVLGPFVKSIADGLASQGHEVSVLMFSSSRRGRERMENGVRVVEYAYSGPFEAALHRHKGLIPTLMRSWGARFQLPLYLLATFSALWRESKRHEVIHAHWLIPSGFLASLAARGVPFVVTAWGAEFHLPENGFFRLLFSRVQKKAIRIVAVSEYMRQRARRYGLDSERIRVVPNCIEVRRFLRERKKGPILSIGTVRRFVPEKRIQDLIEAAAIVRQRYGGTFELHLVGDGPERASLEALVKERGLDDCVRFLGMLPHSDIPDTLSRMDIYVNPSVQEGMATANLEAMCAGCCVVATRGVGNDEVIEHGSNGYLYDAMNVEELAEQLAELGDNAALRERLGKAAQAKVRGAFDYKRIAELYLEQYLEAVERRGLTK